ncbi:prephenate dehydrogenase/arogenate dehydrogenase family protein [bacterium]|nr:prephenate dehydrogenase/arogenate dehydrogenase family protein [bacterium]
MSQTISQISIVGLGLIGGSIAKAVRKYHPGVSIIAWDSNQAYRKAAFKENIVNRTLRPPEIFEGSDIAFICVPPTDIASYMEQATQRAPSAIITDVGSVKSKLAQHFGNTRYGNIVLGHPMAGKQTSGWKASDAELFQGNTWVICPRPANSSRAIAKLKTFVRKLGAQPVDMSASNHDRRVAVCSHLPQLLATALAEFAASEKSKDSQILQSAGPAFHDMTRLAESPFAMWQNIFSANEKEIEKALDGFIKILLRYRKTIGKQSMEKSFKKAAELKRELKGSK